MSPPLTYNSPRKHTEKHGIFINNVDIFSVIPCDSLAIYQDQGLSKCHSGTPDLQALCKVVGEKFVKALVIGRLDGMPGGNRFFHGVVDHGEAFRVRWKVHEVFLMPA